MPDQYQAVRSIALSTVFGWLGIDLSSFKTRKGGSEKYGKCFFHGAKGNNTSLSFTDDLAHCFSCNVKFRGAIDAVKLVRQCSFTEAVAFLQERIGKEPPPTKKEPVEALVASDGVLKPLLKDTWKNYQVECEWLTKRVPDKRVRERYGVFFYQNNARKSQVNGHVLIPIRDVEGVNYGYLARNIGEVAAERPKYRLPANLPKSRFLFGSDQLCTFGQLPLKRIYLVESPFCVMKFASLGLPAVSPFGWSVSEQQIDILVGLAKGIVYLPDRNKSTEAQAIIPKMAQKLWVRSPPLPPDCDDPEKMKLEQILALTK